MNGLDSDLSQRGLAGRLAQSMPHLVQEGNDMTKTDRIRQMLKEGNDSRTIADAVGVSVNRVCAVRWRGKHRFNHAAYMRRYRADHPAYYERELRENNWRRKCGLIR